MVLCFVSMLYCTAWWKCHRLQAFLFPRNPRRIMRERLVCILRPIPFQPVVATQVHSHAGGHRGGFLWCLKCGWRGGGGGSVAQQPEGNAKLTLPLGFWKDHDQRGGLQTSSL